MMACYGNAFCITGPLWVESISDRRIPLTEGQYFSVIFPLFRRWISCLTYRQVAGDLRFDGAHMKLLTVKNRGSSPTTGQNFDRNRTLQTYLHNFHQLIVSTDRYYSMWSGRNCMITYDYTQILKRVWPCMDNHNASRSACEASSEFPIIY